MGSVTKRLLTDSCFHQKDNQTCQLLTVCAASGSLGVAKHRQERHGSTVVAEDMEGFAVAMACEVAGIPLRIVRGISNVAGDRDSSNWQIDAALKSVAEAIQN